VDEGDARGGLRIRAYCSSRTGERLSIIGLKQFCAEHLPLYMIPDTFGMLEALPRTSTDKIDYQQLKTLT
jgi:acyl-CoA synthetase (AMP-forming)/AMP-acid ligase II